MVSGQPGIGKTAFLHLQIVESMIAGEPFLYQTVDRHVYHVAKTVTRITSWPSREPITAFLDADTTSRQPEPFLLQKSIQIIAVSSPEGAEEPWLKQGHSSSRVLKLASALWSTKELFLTGTFLAPEDLTGARIMESTLYFGNNPRRCFSTTVSNLNMRHECDDVLKSIRSIPSHVPLIDVLMNTHRSESVSHSIFELSPVDEWRSLDGAQIDAVSPWALDALLTMYERRNVVASAEFYQSISGISWAGSLRGRVMERQLLKHFVRLPETTFRIRSLTDSTIHDWKYLGPVQRVKSESRLFTSFLLNVANSKQPLHLVPKDPNFLAVLYDPNAVLTVIKSTINPEPKAVSGFQRIQRWLELCTPLADDQPLTSGPHWRLIFAVPETMAQSFHQQDFEGDAHLHDWNRKVDQYVLAVDDLSLRGKAMKV